MPTTGNQFSGLDAISAALLLFVILPRAILIPITALGPDEGMYALVARDLLHGVLPYDGVFEHKPAALYYAFGAFQAVFGHTVLAMRLLAACVTLITALLLAGIARWAFQADRHTQATLIAAFGAWALANDGVSSQTELIVNLWMSAALWISFRYELHARVRPVPASVSGLFLAAAFHTNYLAGFAILGFCAVMIVYCTGSNARTAIRMLFGNGVFICIGFVLGAALLLAPIAVFGNIYAYFAAQITFLTNYTYPTVSPLEVVKIALTAVRVYLPLIALPLAGLAVSLGALKGRLARHLVAFAGYTAFASGAGLVSGHFNHRFILLLPGFILLAGSTLSEFLNGERTIASAILTASAFLVLTIGSPAGYLLVGGKAWAAITRGAPADGLAGFAAAVSTKVAPNESVYVYNAEPVLYMLLGKPAPTRFPFPGHAITFARAAGLDAGDLEEVRRILKTEPRVIIVAAQSGEQHDELTRVLEDEIHRSYELVIEDRWNEFGRDRMFRAFRRKPVSQSSP
jgi:hypothetical protein